MVPAEPTGIVTGWPGSHRPGSSGRTPSAGSPSFVRGHEATGGGLIHGHVDADRADPGRWDGVHPGDLDDLSAMSGNGSGVSASPGVQDAHRPQRHECPGCGGRSGQVVAGHVRHDRGVAVRAVVEVDLTIGAHRDSGQVRDAGLGHEVDVRGDRPRTAGPDRPSGSPSSPRSWPSG